MKWIINILKNGILTAGGMRKGRFYTVIWAAATAPASMTFTMDSQGKKKKKY